MRSAFRKTCLVGLLSTSAACLSSPAAQFTTEFNNNGTAPPGSAVAGNAFVDTAGGVGGSGVLKLTGNAAGQQGGYYVSDFAGGAGVSNFVLVARLAIGGGTTRPADGMAFAFGTDVGGPPATFGEEGVGTGITVTVDTWDNNGDDTAPAFDVRYGGAILAFQSMATNGGAQTFREGARNAAGPVLTNAAGMPVSLQTFGPGQLPTDSSFVNLIIQLFPDNTLSLSWSNVVVFDHLPLPGYTPISGGTWAFGGRTGGATEDHWIDNLGIFANYTAGPATITAQPADQSAIETQRAIFSAQVNGTPPFTAQWFSNNVAIPGADQLTYTTPPATTNMNGVVYRVEVRNAQNVTPVVSGNATLTVIPGLVLQSASSRNTATNVFVVFNKPAQRVGSYSLSPPVVINAVKPGAAPNEVLLETAPLATDANYTLTVTGEKGTDGSTLLPDPSTARFHYGFGAFCHDFNDNVQPAGTVFANNSTASAFIAGGFVHLTDAGVNGAVANYWIPDQVNGSPLDRLQARWRSYIGDGGGGGADGYSFSWGTDLPSPPVGGPYGGEEGAGTGLSVTVDTFDNGGGETGLEIRWKGQQVAFMHIDKDDPGNGVFLRKSRFVDASVEVLPNGQATFNYDGQIITATLPDFAPIAGGNFIFAARTGGANDSQWVDDVRINCFTLGPPVFTLQPANTTVIEGDSATFTVAVEGAPPLTIQWYTNGVPVPGAITTSYTTPPGTAALNGLQVSARANNDFGGTASSVATLTVRLAPRIISCSMGCEPNIIHVLYTKPVQLDGSYSTDIAIVNGVSYGASQSEVLLDIDPLPPETTVTVTIQDVHDQGGNVQFPNPAICVARYGFGPLCTDFSALPPGAQLQGVATVGGPGASDGILHLTDDGANGVCGGLFIPNQNGAAPLDRLHVRWKSLIGGVDQVDEAQQFGTGGADGYSLSWGADVAPGCAGPEGTGSGLIVTVDTFDNGSGTGLPDSGGEAPAIEIKWKGARVAASYIGLDPAANKNFLRKGSFVDAELAVFPDGTAQFTYDGVTISATLPGFAPVAGANFLFSASTGGAQDNHWIDDLCINDILSGTNGPVLNCPREVVAECTGGLTPVTWTVSARDFCEGPVPVICVPPSGTGFRIGQSNVVCTARNGAGGSSSCSFVVRIVDTTAPQLSCPTDMLLGASGPNGAIAIYTAGAFDACGIADFNCSPPSGSTFPIGTNTVTCTASDTSRNTNSCSFTIIVVSINHAPSFTKGNLVFVTADFGPVTVPAWAKNISAGPPDEAGQTLTFLVSNDNPGLFSSQPAIAPNGTLTFRTAPGACGNANVTVVLMDDGGTANGGVDRSEPCTFQIVVQCNVNHCPVAKINTSVMCVTSNQASMLLVAGDNDHACIIFDGTLSSDADGDALTYLWIADGAPVPFSTAALNTNCFLIGEHDITLVVDDGKCLGMETVHLEVVTACDLVENLIQDINNSTLPRNKKRPLIDSLKKICSYFEKDKKNKFKQAIQKLEDFQHKLKGELKKYPVEQAQFYAEAQAIIDAINCAVDLNDKMHPPKPPGPPHPPGH